MAQQATDGRRAVRDPVDVLLEAVIQVELTGVAA
jgi:hypothetical protein